MEDDNARNDGGPGASQKQRGKGPVRLQIKVKDETAHGVYANLALVHNNDQEFVLDFVFAEPQRPTGHVVARVVVNPRTVKRLTTGLAEAIRRFEERFGEIALPEPGPTPGTSYH